MKLAPAALAALLVVTGSWRGRDESGARPGRRTPWWGWWRASGGRAMQPVEPDALCVTLGAVEPAAGGRFLVRDPKVRGYGVRSDGSAAELRFVYRGPSAGVSRLGSGKLFRQLGLKLNARDGCNVIYVMWRVEPATGVEVLVKQNPGQSVHAECGNRGYRKVKPAISRPVPRLEPGSQHRLRAELDGSRLVARVDGVPVFEADLGEVRFAGPAGFRTDNIQAEVELLARRSDRAVPCTRGGD